MSHIYYSDPVKKAALIKANRDRYRKKNGIPLNSPVQRKGPKPGCKSDLPKDTVRYYRQTV